MWGFIMKLFSSKNSFLVSILIGGIIWGCSYVILPINTASISLETKGFIFSCIIALLLGFFVADFKKKLSNIKGVILKKHYIIGLIILFIAYLFRYLDLFLYRDMSFGLSYYENKNLSIQNAFHAPFFITIISTLRVLYFIPLLHLVLVKSKDKLNWVLALLLLLLSSLEIFLVGTRKPVFYVVIILVLAILHVYKRKEVFTKKNILLGATGIIALGVFSFLILNKRVSENTGSRDGILKVVDSRYNDFVKINESKIEELYQNHTGYSSKTQILLIHTGQYIVHGAYELDYVINKDLPRAHGIYSFNPVFKLLNRIGITSIDIDSLKEYHPREYVYVTFFGSLFIDFGWVSVLIVFLFGVFQKLIYQLSEINPTAKLFWIILLSINITMPIFNLTAGAGLYLMFYMVVLVIASFKLKHEKQ